MKSVIRTERTAFERRIWSNRGAGLVEVLIAAGISMIVFVSILSTVSGISAITALSRHYTQAMHVVRGEAEELRGTQFSTIANSVAQVPYDAGSDNVFGTPDDLMGTLTVTVADRADFDGDNITGETTIDVNGDGVNDCTDFPACTDPYTKPVRISLNWSERFWSLNKNVTVSLDTLIAQ